MWLRLASLLAIASLTAVEAQWCTNISSLGYATTCPPQQGVPGCDYIWQNIPYICENVATGYVVVNGPSCSFLGSGYGCAFYQDTNFDTPNKFCCDLSQPTLMPIPSVSSTPTPSVTPSISITSSPSQTPTISETPSTSITRTPSQTPSVSITGTPSPSQTPSQTPSPTPTPTPTQTPTPTTSPMRNPYLYDSAYDFKGVQGYHGWNYYYYPGTEVGYVTPNLYDSYTNNKWMYSTSCAGWISATQMMPNDALSCNSPNCGPIQPAIKWTNPNPAIYMLLTVTFQHWEEGGQGDFIHMYLNGQMVYNEVVTYAMGVVTWQTYGYITTFELQAQPWNGCDYSNMNYNIVVFPVPLSPSWTSTASLTSTASATSSASQSAVASSTSTVTSQATTSASASYSGYATSHATPSASASASVSATSQATSSASPSASASASYSGYASWSASPSFSATRTETAMTSLSPSASASPSATSSASWSAAGTISATSTVSVSPSVTPTPSPDWFNPPAIPQNLTNISASEAVGYMNMLAAYDASVIQDSLNALGSALLSAAGNGSVSISTSTFKMTLAALPNTNGTATLSQGTTAVALPPLKDLVPGAAAASMIQWKNNPFISTVPDQKPDAGVLSLSVLGADGSALTVANLSTPIIMSWPQTLAANDPRIQTPPSYVVRCDTGAVFLTTGDQMTAFHGANHTRTDLWEVPCLMNTTNYIQCTSFLPYTYQPYQCPKPAFDHSCIYWSPSKKIWTDDGCVPAYANLTYASCKCTHMTDFSSRISAIASSNKAIFDNAGNVYSAAGLRTYAQWFGLFGGIGAVTLLIGIIVTRVDLASTRRYVHSLLRNKYLREFLDRRPSSPLYLYDLWSTLDRYHKTKKELPPVKTVSLSQRIWQQHPSLQFIFRYDPRLSRLFRLLFLFIVQFHALFITALLYGFTYGVEGGKASMTIADTILLSLITMSLSIPVVQVLLRGLNHVGTQEFQAQFPVLFEEYTRRSNFEKIALVYFHKKDGLVLDAAFLKVPGVDDLMELPLKQLLKEMANVISKPWNLISFPMSCWRIWPAHTGMGALFLLLCFGYFGFVLNYLILFAAGHQTSVGEQIMTSWGISQISSIFLIQPLTITFTLGFYWFLNKYSACIPKFVRNNILVPAVRSIPSIFYFTNPWASLSHSPLTAQFAYTLFTRCSAYASHAEELAYAPMEAIATSVGTEIADITVDAAPGDENTVKGLYEKYWRTFAELNR